MRRLSLVAVAVLISACTAGEPTQETTTTGATTTGPTTTTTTTAATTTAPLRTIDVMAAGDVPDGVATAAAAVLSKAADQRNPDPDAAEGLVAHLAALTLPDSITIVSMRTATLPDGQVLGVARTDSGDVVLAIDETSGWRIVGADMGSLGAEPWYGESPHMVLIIGSDARPGQDPVRFHADSIHVVTAIPERGTGAILGWPRDSFVPTPYGDMKITALMVNRGPEVMKTFFEDHWELPIEGYIATGFRGFENLIGVLGRLVIDIPRALPTQEWFAGFSAGEQSLTPVRALDYARTRKRVPGGDLTRSFNQGLVMLAALRMIQMNGIDEVPDLVAALVEHTYTDLTPEQLLQLGASAFAIDPGVIENQVLPGEVGRAVGASVVFLDPEAEVIIADLREDGLLNPAP